MYILTLTLIFNLGWSSIGGGLGMHQFNTLEDCEKVGSAWIEDLKSKREAKASPGGFYRCTRIEENLVHVG